MNMKGIELLSMIMVAMIATFAVSARDDCVRGSCKITESAAAAAYAGDIVRPFNDDGHGNDSNDEDIADENGIRLSEYKRAYEWLKQFGYISMAEEDLKRKREREFQRHRH